MHARNDLAGAVLLSGDAAAAIGHLDRLRALPFVFQSGDVVRTNALLDLGRYDEALQVFRGQLEDAISSRVRQIASDALFTLASVLIVEGDHDRARTTLFSAGPARSPSSNSLSRRTADRLGVRSEFDQFEAKVSSRTDAEHATAMSQNIDMLRVEATRRGWVSP